METSVSKKRVTYASAVKRLFNLNNADARLVVRRLIRESGVFETTFVDGNPYRSAFNEGQRHVVCSLLKCMNMDTELALAKIAELERENEAES